MTVALDDVFGELSINGHMRRLNTSSSPQHPFRGADGGAARSDPTVRSPQQGDGKTFLPLRLRSISWSPIFLGFLIYIFTITTFRLPLGDAAVGVALLGLLIQRGPLRFPPLVTGYAILLAWCAISGFQSRYSDVVWETLLESAKLGLIILVAVNALRTPQQIRFLVIFWLGCYALFPVRGAYLNYLAGYRVMGRALWNFIYANPNDLAALTLLQLSLAAGVLISEPRGWIRRAALLGIGLLVVLIFMTQSRGALLGLFAFGVLSFVGSHRRLRSAALLTVVAGAVWLAAPAGVWERLGGLSKAASVETLSEVDPEGSADQRYRIWQTAWAITADHPILGVGWGAYPLANARYAPAGGVDGLGERDAHSTYFRTVAEIGYPGLLIFLALIAAVVFYAEKVRRRARTTMQAMSQLLFYLELGLMAFLIAGIFGSFSRLSFLYLHLALIYAVARVASEAFVGRRSAQLLAPPPRQGRRRR